MKGDVAMHEFEIIDRYGRRRRARRGEVPADGETVHFPQQFMDAAAVLAQKYGHQQTPRGYVRGYAFADTTSASLSSQQAAAEAYEERNQRLQNAWRKKHQDASSDDTPLPTQDAWAIADQAYEDKKQRLQNGWRLK
jgi:hypothetical protein